MAELKIDTDSMKALVLKAILESWTPEQRDQLVMDAMSYLLTDKADRNDYSRNPQTVIDRILKQAVAVAAEQVVKELIEEQYKDKLVELIDPKLAEIAAFVNINDALANAITTALREKRGY
jgi:hypothetical protein